MRVYQTHRYFCQILSKKSSCFLNEKNIIPTLNATRAATQAIVREGNNAKYYILILDYQKHTVSIQEYAERELELATKAYKVAEEQAEKKKQNVVLVSANSIKELRTAYPNYFTDVGDFVRGITAIIDEN